MVQINTPARNSHLVAFFSNQADALSAVSELKDAGFTSDQIGLAMPGHDLSVGPAVREHVSTPGSAVSSTDVAERERPMTGDDRSAWEKIKDFFRGQDETYAGEDYGDAFRHLSISDERSRYYSSGIARGGAVVTVRVAEDQIEKARQILTDNDGDLRTSGFGAEVSTAPVAASPSGERRIQLRGELLRAIKERVQKGEVRLRKEIVTEQQTVNVPVSREEVIVEQVPASETQQGAGSGRIGEQGEVRIPVSEERVKVSKEPVVTGEVRVQKRTVHDTEQVSDQVRHEEMKVENEGKVNVTDKTKGGKKKPAA
jgi:uncharacterized protein (TIGR02271 family)